MSYGPYIAAAVAGYLLGSLPFGYLVARAHGVDIFKTGSGNPGATNVKRVCGARAGNTVFALDAVKGAAASGWPLLCVVFGCPFFSVGPEDIKYVQLIGVISAILGHSFSVFTGFKGGKGVATAAGGLLVLMPVSCLVGGVVWLATFYGTRFVSLASILAAIAVPVASWLRGNPLALNIVATVIGLFVVLRHHENIRRLLNGTESRFVRKSEAAPDAGTKPSTKS
jgi:acyl phosphate:glycerol-3-phosphate acyltransferase